MQHEKRNNSKDYSKQIDESIANAKERKKQALEENSSLSEEQLETLSGGGPIHPHTTMGAISEW